MNGSKIMFAHRWRLINERLENKPSSLFLILFEREEGVLFHEGETWRYYRDMHITLRTAILHLQRIPFLCKIKKMETTDRPCTA